MKATLDYNNLARGQSDHDLIGRNDLPVFSTSAEAIKNFITNFKGCAIYRTGWERMIKFEDCVFHEFAFNEEQNYILVFYNTKLRFLTYDSGGVFGWVGAPLEVTTPYSLAECRELQFARHEDTVYVVHPNHPPYKLVRTGASTFTFSTYTRTSDPFTDTSSTSIAVSTGSKTFTVTANKPYTVGQSITIKYNDSNYLVGNVTSYSTTSLVVDVTSVVGSGTYTSWTLIIGYPACVAFYGARLFFARTPSKITTLFGSKAGEYDDFTIPSTIDDDDALRFTIAELSEQIEWLVAGENSLVAGARDGIAAINGGAAGDAITANNVSAKITSVDGAGAVSPVRKDGAIIYIGKNYRNTYYFSYNILTESFEAPDANIASFDVTKSGFKKARWKKDRNDIIYFLREDGHLATLNFMKSENIIGWHEHDSFGVDNDEIKDIAVITDNDGSPSLFGLIYRNGEYYIERKAAYKEFSKRVDFYTGDIDVDDEAWYRKVSDELTDCIYLDSALCYSDYHTETITYNPSAGTITSSGSVFSGSDVGHHIVYKTATGYEHGRFEITGYTSGTVVTVSVLDAPTANSYASWYMTFSVLSGLGDYAGTTLSIVSDGGYYTDQYVTPSDEVYFDHECAVACVGYKYKGLIKKFPLGFAMNGKNAFNFDKNVCTLYLTLTNSWGCSVGTSQYHTQNVQRLTSKDINYLPTYPMNGVQKVDYRDDATTDKSIYIIQDDPSPLNISRISVEANYAIS